jgi:hypothetical protein
MQFPYDDNPFSFNDTVFEFFPVRPSLMVVTIILMLLRIG